MDAGAAALPCASRHPTVAVGGGEQGTSQAVAAATAEESEDPVRFELAFMFPEVLSS